MRREDVKREDVKTVSGGFGAQTRVCKSDCEIILHVFTFSRFHVFTFHVR
jgi:hypothetical protein